MTHFRSSGQKSKNNFVRFLVQMRTRKFAFWINWLLAWTLHNLWRYRWPFRKCSSRSIFNLLVFATAYIVECRTCTCKGYNSKANWISISIPLFFDYIPKIFNPEKRCTNLHCTSLFLAKVSRIHETKEFWHKQKRIETHN